MGEGGGVVQKVFDDLDVAVGGGIESLTLGIVWG